MKCRGMVGFSATQYYHSYATLLKYNAGAISLWPHCASLLPSVIFCQATRFCEGAFAVVRDSISHALARASSCGTRYAAIVLVL